MPTDEARAKLAQDQARLIAALTGGSPPPEGFDADQVFLVARTLASKRRHGVETAWPRLARALGDDFAPIFREYDASTTVPPLLGPVADGYRFAEALRRSGRFPEGAEMEWLAIRLHYRAVAEGLERRRWPTICVSGRLHPFRLFVAVGWPGRFAWWGRFSRSSRQGSGLI